MFGKTILQSILGTFILLCVANCADGDQYNAGDPAAEEYYLRNALHCLLRDPVCPSIAPLQPTALGSNLRLWLEADGVTANDGASVSAWADQSGNGFNATQSTAAQQPTYQVGAMGGQPALRFNSSQTPGTNLTLGANYIYSTNDGVSIMAVVRSNAEDNNLSFILDFGLQSTDGYGLAYSANPDGQGNNLRTYTPSAAGGTALLTPYQSTTLEPVIIFARTKFAPATDHHQTIFVNGSAIASSAHSLTQLTAGEINEASTRMSTDGPITIGGQAKTQSETGRFFAGDMGLVMVFDKALTEAERRGLECYASLKYGIALAYGCF